MSKYNDKVENDETCCLIPQLSNNMFLLLSERCQLNCIYCYADSINRGKDMNIETAETAIDFLANNVLMRKNMNSGDIGYITFHGGGEPTINMPLLKHIVEYAESVFSSKGLKLITNILTNGILTNTNEIIWLTKHINYIQVSLDGLKGIQDVQRPFRNGLGSFEIVNSFLMKLCDLEKYFSIHVTVTNINEPTIVDFVDVVKQTYTKCHKLILSPLHAGGRADSAGFISLTNFKELYKLVEKKLYGSNINLIGPSYVMSSKSGFDLCDASMFKTITVTPKGAITFCHETMRNEKMEIGEISSTGIIFNKKKILEIKSRIDRMINESKESDSPNLCKLCFAEFANEQTQELDNE